MSSRRGHSLPPAVAEKPRRGRCVSAICLFWKIFTCILSHVTLVSLVVMYCIGGALLFQYLEEPHEREVKRGIKNLRWKVTESIWKMTEETLVLEEDKWIDDVKGSLMKFEKEILSVIKTQGFNGEEDEKATQWSFIGALFYSIIVITTIGYGHIAPRTDWGKVSTIFYAILGIPLMLLCFSNIGDVMATSFRFLYWRVCCYVCTRPPKRNRRSRTRSIRSHQRFSRSQPPPSMRRSMKHSQRSGDSGFEPSEGGMFHSHSDTDLRYPARGGNRDRCRGREPYFEESDRGRFSNRQRFKDRRSRHQFEEDADEFYYTQPRRGQSVRGMARAPPPGYSNTLPSNKTRYNRENSRARAKSVDPRGQFEEDDIEMGQKSPILCNRYALDELEREGSVRSQTQTQTMPRQQKRQPAPRESNTMDNRQRRASCVPMPQSRFGNRLEIPGMSPPRQGRRRSRSTSHYDGLEDQFEDNHRFDRFERFERERDRDRDRDRGEYPMRQRDSYRDRYRDRPKNHKRERNLPPSPRIMSPLGFAVHRQARMRATTVDEDSLYGDEWDSTVDISPKDGPVPIWLCVFLVVGYILGGAVLFNQWEGWTYLDSAYFCFITLTTIGFGDFVPAKGVRDNSRESIALCSLYLLFGISLLAMSFNLVQEEFIANVKGIARRLGIIKDEEDDDD